MLSYVGGAFNPSLLLNIPLPPDITPHPPVSHRTPSGPALGILILAQTNDNPPPVPEKVLPAPKDILSFIKDPLIGLPAATSFGYEGVWVLS